MKRIALFIVGALFISQPARVWAEIPETRADTLTDWHHLSEGSEFIPTDWLLALKDPAARNLKTAAKYVDTLGSIGARRDNPAANPYLVDWVGVTSAWSDHDPSSSDALKGDDKVRVRWIGPAGRRASIKMSGINCSFCHTTEVHFAGNAQVIEGGPGQVDIQGLFHGMVRSLLMTMLNPARLAQFLGEFGVKNPKWHADVFVVEFMASLGIPSMIELGGGNPGKHFYAKNEVVKTYLLKLLSLTHRIGSRNDLGILTERMRFLADLMDGQPPGGAYTTPGFGRIDAFGGSSNTILRPRSNPIDTSAPVSVPQLWGLSHKAVFEWEGITNSVLLRNGAQAAALGAAIRSPDGTPAMNLRNMNRLETLLEKFEAPSWSQVFGDAPGFAIDPAHALRGKEIYEARCASCHTPEPRAAGPAGVLFTPKSFALSEIHTDPAAAITVATPIRTSTQSIAFGDAVTGALSPVIRDYAARWDVSASELAEWGRESIRGTPFFREPLLGWQGTADFSAIPMGTGYVANSLAGIWATAPFLHNNSVPTMRDLLEPATKRPATFTLGDREYDPARLGYRFRAVGACGKDDPRCLDTSQPGNSNRGHEYGTDLADEDKDALVEYLKAI